MINLKYVYLIDEIIVLDTFSYWNIFAHPNKIKQIVIEVSIQQDF